MSGEGARLAGGRWNTRGTAIAYTSESLSLATLELLVHLPSTALPRDLVVIEIRVPDGLSLETLSPHLLPRDWDSVRTNAATEAIGTEWKRSERSLLLRVPSVVIPWEWNVLINPAHPEFSELEVVRSDFTMDPRLHH